MFLTSPVGIALETMVSPVIAIPDTAAAGVWTLWTHDFPRTGGGNAAIARGCGNKSRRSACCC